MVKAIYIVLHVFLMNKQTNEKQQLWIQQQHDEMKTTNAHLQNQHQKKKSHNE